MPPLSATDAITPAWQHTRRFLLGPRSARLLFKIAAVAFFAEIGGMNASFRGPINSIHHGHAGAPHVFSPGLIAVLVIGSLVAMLIGLAFFYLSSRLQFVLFHSVLRCETWIAPIWHRYGAATWRWIGLKLLLFLAFFACMIPVLIPTVIFFVHAAQKQPAGGQIVSFVFAIFFFVLVIGVLVLALTVAYILLRDFGLPSMALEATSLRETVGRVLGLVRAEPGQIALYVLLRFALALAGTLVCYLAVLVIGLVMAVPLGGVAVAFWAALHGSSFAGHAVMIAAFVALGLILCAALFVTVITLLGYLFTFLEAYAIFFLSGRYPLLFQQLTPPSPEIPRPWSFAPWTPWLYPPQPSGSASPGVA
jgi:hypothetical protein